MIKVKDHSAKSSELLGQEVACVDIFCPCRSCFGVMMTVDDKGKESFHCRRLMEGNCHPEFRKPRHKLTRARRGGMIKCAVCGQHIDVGYIKPRKVAENEKTISP